MKWSHFSIVFIGILIVFALTELFQFSKSYSPPILLNSATNELFNTSSHSKSPSIPIILQSPNTVQYSSPPSPPILVNNSPLIIPVLNSADSPPIIPNPIEPINNDKKTIIEPQPISTKSELWKEKGNFESKKRLEKRKKILLETGRLRDIEEKRMIEEQKKVEVEKRKELERSLIEQKRAELQKRKEIERKKLYDLEWKSEECLNYISKINYWNQSNTNYLSQFILSNLNEENVEMFEKCIVFPSCSIWDKKIKNINQKYQRLKEDDFKKGIFFDEKIRNIVGEYNYIKDGFSQDGQDRLVDILLDHKSNGWFIEIGAFDSITASNSYFFSHCRNWNGILIEPHPYSFGILSNIYQHHLNHHYHRISTPNEEKNIKIENENENDNNNEEEEEYEHIISAENICISDEDKIINFTIASTLSGIAKKYSSQHLERIDNEMKIKNTYNISIQSKRLTHLLSSYFIFNPSSLSLRSQFINISKINDISLYQENQENQENQIKEQKEEQSNKSKHNINQNFLIDFLAIDVEGAEFDIIKSMKEDDIGKYFSIIGFENNYHENDNSLQSLLNSMNFYLYKLVGGDELYVRKDLFPFLFY